MLDELAANRKQLLIILGLILIITAGLLVLLFRHLAPQTANEILAPAPITDHLPVAQEEPAKILVHISGAVRRAGVYRLAPDDRILDVLKLAGGARPTADLHNINLAEKVKDGQKIIVPEKVFPSPVSADQPSTQTKSHPQANSGPVSLNTATAASLRQVKGIGPATAKKIIEYRGTHGPFTKVEDLMKVKGIGKGKFEKMKGQITL
ncbi:ComEA family DNA-binding protein [Candidatus Saganbacteria bacterium]|nr:ComEA family DNA-binding protein [Candidatus Saganbacteria bacterium]